MIDLAKQGSQTFVFGAVILMISNILVKIIGAVFKIPLTNIIGVDGMAYFNAAYSIYVTLYNVSTSGLPVAISRMVAAENAKGNLKAAGRIFSVAFRLFFFIGLAGTLIMTLFADRFAAFCGLAQARLATVVIAPTLFFICLSSACRGYFQGLQNMVPTAVSNIIEAVGKLGIGLAAAWYFCLVKQYPLPEVAAFVISGVTVGVFAAMVYIYIEKARFCRTEDFVKRLNDSEALAQPPRKRILRELVVTAVPIVLASSVIGLTNTADTFLIARRLAEAGLPTSAATSFYGTYSAMTVPLFNMIPPLIYPFAIGIIPALSASISKGDSKACATQTTSAFRLAAIVAVPCAVGMCVLSGNIISFLFSGSRREIVFGETTVTTTALAAAALRILAPAIFFLGMIAITNAVLQAYRQERKTILSTTAGIVVKILLTYWLSAVPDFGINGAAVGTAACYFTVFALNLYFVIKYTHFVPRIRDVFLKPAVAGLLCGAAAVMAVKLLDGHMPDKLVTLAAILLAAFVYGAVLLVIRGVAREDLLMLPKGEKLCRVMDKCGLLG